MVKGKAMECSAYDIPYRGGFVGAEHRFALSVYFEDTDTAGIVYYANYLKYMERARSDMLRAVGIDQRAALDAGTGVYAVADVAIRYLRPARLGDDLVDVSGVETVRAAMMQAMKEHDKERKEALSLLLSALKNKAMTVAVKVTLKNDFIKLCFN